MWVLVSQGQGLSGVTTPVGNVLRCQLSAEGVTPEFGAEKNEEILSMFCVCTGHEIADVPIDAFFLTCETPLHVFSLVSAHTTN